MLDTVQVQRMSTGVYELVNTTRDDGSQSESTSFTLAVKARMRLCLFLPCLCRLSPVPLFLFDLLQHFVLPLLHPHNAFDQVLYHTAVVQVTLSM